MTAVLPSQVKSTDLKISKKLCDTTWLAQFIHIYILLQYIVDLPRIPIIYLADTNLRDYITT